MSSTTVADVMTDTVRSLNEDALLSAARQLFLDHGISGAPVVDNNGKAIGMITAKRLVNQPNWTVQEVMSTPVEASSPGATLVMVARRFLSRNVRRLPVIDDDQKLVGIITPQDIVRQMLELELDMKIRDLNPAGAVTVHEDTDLEASFSMMKNRNLSAAAVVDSNGKLVGVVTMGDLLLGAHLHLEGDQHPGESSSAPWPGDMLERLTMAYDEGKFVLSDRTVRTIMSTEPVFVTEEAKVSEVCRIMVEKRLDHLPMIGSSDRITGMVRNLDLLRLFIAGETRGWEKIQPRTFGA